MTKSTVMPPAIYNSLRYESESLAHNSKRTAAIHRILAIKPNIGRSALRWRIGAASARLPRTLQKWLQLSWCGERSQKVENPRLICTNSCTRQAFFLA